MKCNIGNACCLQESCAIAKMTARCALYKRIKWAVAEIWPFAYLGCIWNPHFRERGGRRGSAMAPFERAMVVSYRLSIVTVALSVTIRPQFAIECLRRSNQQGGGSLWAKISGCSPWSRPLVFGFAESEHPRLTNCEIFRKNSNRRDHNPPKSQTDGQTTCDRKTTLCPKSASRGKNLICVHISNSIAAIKHRIVYPIYANYIVSYKTNNVTIETYRN